MCSAEVGEMSSVKTYFSEQATQQKNAKNGPEW